MAKGKEPDTVTISRQNYMEVAGSAYAAMLFSTQMFGLLVQKGAITPEEGRKLLSDLIAVTSALPDDSPVGLSVKQLKVMLHKLNTAFAPVN